jgi:hypothetical protein
VCVRARVHTRADLYVRHSVCVCLLCAHAQNARAGARSHTCTHEQDRFEGSMTSLQRANPEVTKIHETMPTGKLICVLPAVCITGGF